MSAGNARRAGRGGNLAPGAGFGGFPSEALDFYEDLEADNSKVFWQAHRDIYAACVRRPMLDLVGALEAEFGPAKLFRPYRDMRFARDRTPYKTEQGAFVGVAPETGWYVQISASGVRVAGGCYRTGSAGIAAIRTAIDGARGAELARLVGRLRRVGWQIAGERLRTQPRGYPGDHPRIDLLRYKSLIAERDYGPTTMVQSAELLDRVRADWRALRPLVEWFADRLAGTACD